MAQLCCGLLLRHFTQPKMPCNKGVSNMPENNSQGPPRDKPSGPLAAFHSLSSGAWRILLSFPVVLLVIVLMAGAAFWEARTPVTMISQFRLPQTNLPKTNLPFDGDIVADSVQDALKSIRNEIEETQRDPGLKSSETGLPNLRNMLVPKLRRIQAPPRFTVEIKGISYERVLSIARAILHTETTISGDVVVQGNQFILKARAADAGPWESIARPTTIEGLMEATKDLAKKILMTQDPTLEGLAMLKEGDGEGALAALDRALSLDPSDVRLKLNLCLGFAANRRYEEAIDCYNDVLKKERGSKEVWEQLAQTYYLEGKHRPQAIDLYRDLAFKQGYRQALLGLAEALDDSHQSLAALDLYNEFLKTERQDRNRALAHVKKGLALSHLGDHDGALDEYREALRFAPRDVLILVHKSIELADAVGTDAGIAELESIVNENQDSASAPFASLQLGLLLKKNNDWKGAIDQFQKAVQRQPNYVEAQQQLAKALVHQGDVKRARPEFEKWVKLSGTDLQRGYYKIFASLWLGNALREIEKYSDAASAYRDAIRVQRDFATAHCELGQVLAKLGHVREAIDEYGRALVPVAMKELSDPGCTAKAPTQLVALLTSEGKERTVASAVHYRQSRRVLRTNTQPVQDRNGLVLALEKQNISAVGVRQTGGQ
jgi:tetratricopeptide (TPR) repeat protein